MQHAHSPHLLRELLRLPFKRGRLLWTPDNGQSMRVGSEHFQTRLVAHHYDPKGRLIKKHDLGSGLTTQSLALAMANAGVSLANANILSAVKYMASGTGTNAAQAYDYQLQTQSGPVTGALTPTVGVAADNGTMQWVGTITYGGSLAVTEWGLFAGGGTVGSQYNTSTDTFTGTTATPGVSPAWTVDTWAGMYVVRVSSATPVIGLISHNTATALTVSPGWATANGTGGTGTTPSSNTALDIFPLMADRKQFAAINVNSGDSIQFTYTLTINSGG